MKATREFSDTQEKYLAKILNGKVQSNSGGTRFGGGDVHTEHFLIEAKTPTKLCESFSVKREWLDKMAEQAFEQNKQHSALAFTFEPCGENYFVINERDFKEYLLWKEGLFDAEGK